MKRALLAATALLLLLPGLAVAHVEVVDGCEVILTTSNPDVQVVSVYVAGQTDEWSDFEVVNGKAEMNGTLAPGHYYAVWEDGEEDAFSVTCQPEPINENQDPWEADLCNWVEPNEVVEECLQAITAASAVQHKTTICHVPKGNKGNPRTITVDEHALKAHLGSNAQGLHGGDYFGECKKAEPTPRPTPKPTPEPTGGIGEPSTGSNPNPPSEGSGLGFLPPTDTASDSAQGLSAIVAFFLGVFAGAFAVAVGVWSAIIGRRN